jgi:hypothetical protein
LLKFQKAFMKNLFCIFGLIFMSCAGNTDKTTTVDKMNGIENRHLYDDTAVSPNPDGYAPPNAEIDTSENTKDSIRKKNDQ